MVAIKANLAQGVLRSPDPKHSAYLFYGPDAGLVSERAQVLAKKLAETDQGEVLRLDDADLESDPDRLAVELKTVPMFGGRKIVRATQGRRINTPLIKGLIEDGQLAGVLIVETGNLGPNEALRQLFEKAAHAVAIPCYLDSDKDLAAIVREELGTYKLAISPEAEELLIERLGADRSLSRGEIDKLALYAFGKSRIEIADVEAIVGDASELAIDGVLSATAAGDVSRAVTEIQRLTQSGESAQAVILMLQRHFQRLHRVRIALDAGKSFDDATRVFRPPLHFKTKASMGTETRAWSSARLTEALADIAVAARAARLNGALEDEIAERLVMRLARRVRSSAVNRGFNA